MASRQQRDEWTKFLRRRAARLGAHVGGLVSPRAAELRGRMGRVGRWLGLKLPPSRVLIPVGKLLFLAGPGMVLSWQLLALIGGPALATTEFPLGKAGDVAVDSRGRIYVAEDFHHRVQRYSPDGEFERGWSVPTAGVFALRTTADDRVVVATARANKLLTYDRDGGLLGGLYNQKEDRYREYASETETTGPYAVRRGLLPHVVDARTDRTVVATPWYKRLIAAPFPAMLYAVIGMAIFGLGEWRRSLERAHDEPGPGPKPVQSVPGGQLPPEFRASIRAEPDVAPDPGRHHGSGGV